MLHSAVSGESLFCKQYKTFSFVFVFSSKQRSATGVSDVKLTKNEAYEEVSLKKFPKKGASATNNYK